jgi:hypothetical protein
MKECLPLPYFESERLKDSNRQYHEGGAGETDADGFFVTFVHTTAKLQNYCQLAIVIHHFLYAVRCIMCPSVTYPCGISQIFGRIGKTSYLCT